MRSLPELRVPGRDEVEGIARNLGVPDRMKHDFINWIIDLAVIINDIRLSPSMQDMPPSTERYPLETARQALGNARAAISSMMFVSDMEPSMDLHGSLAVLLGQGSSSRLAAMSMVLSQDASEIEQLASVFQTAVERNAHPYNCDAPGFETPFHDLYRLLAILEYIVARNCSKSRGGRPRHRLRPHLLKDLRELYQSVFSKRATSAPNGKYVLLCEHVFQSYGMSTDGLEEAIKRFLKSPAESQNVQPGGS